MTVLLPGVARESRGEPGFRAIMPVARYSAICQTNRRINLPEILEFMSKLSVKQGASFSPDPAQAVLEVAQAIRQPEACIVIFFASSKYDLVALENALKDVFSCPVIGCTTAGEITSSAGYKEGGMVGVSLSSPHLVAHPKRVAPLSQFGFAEGKSLAQDLRTELKLGNDFDPDKMFGLLLVDGLSMLEEQVVATLYNSLGGMTLIGGSAGDDLSFKETHVYCDGKFLKDAAVITLFETTLPFKAFQIQHFESTGVRLVITESDCASRTVKEINGLPAAEEYAKAVGVN
ncbi:MAG: FIST N-terminal domain-containing protein, partial [Gallionellaceae bacterium]|nr:FIST N-terminal domain-containing protein [Gallionellaceae bacterium]